MKTRRRAATLAILALVLAPGIALSATVLKLDNNQMTARATTIVYGSVEGLTAGQSPNSRLIYTEVKLRVKETWKGKAGASYSFRHPGGVLNGRGMMIAGAARFKLGEEVVLFVDDADPKTGCAFTIGLAQGKFTVERDPATGQKRVHRALTALDFVDGKTLQPTSAPKPDTKLSLADLRAQIRSAVSKLGNK